MKLLVAGLTGQLGTAVQDVAAQRGLRLVGIRRPGSPRRLAGPAVDAELVGDVRAPDWGLDAEALDGPASGVDAVLNLAADTDWAGSPRALFATNALGAGHGFRLTRELGRRAGRPIPYVYTGSVYVAGDAVGEIAERLAPPGVARTAYERSKWSAERNLLDEARGCAGAPLLIARMPALIGDSRTGRTQRRDSLYLLADRWDALPGGFIPAMRDARVDALPRDLAAAALLDAVDAVCDRPPPEPLICHLGLGEDAPTLRGLLAAARALGGQRSRGEPRVVTVSGRALLWASLNLDRFAALGRADHNTLIGLRYVGLDRVFSRPAAARLLGARLPAVEVGTLAGLIFGARPRRLDSASANGSMARFPG